MAKPKEGAPAPDFAVTDDSGNTVKLKDFKGKKLVLYFYPRASTPGCTRESEAFRDAKAKFTRAGAVIVGASRDSEKANTKFKEKYKLTFPLLCDTDEKLVKAYDVLKDKNMYGKKVKGIVRSTFIIDEKGKIAKIFSPVQVDGHVDEVLQAVKEL